jgi:cyclase
MPLCYGGGVKSVEQAKRIIQMGIEKVAISSEAFKNPELVRKISESIGSQSVVCVLDLKKTLFRGYAIYIRNGTKKIEGKPTDWINTFQDLGAGEILINSIDRDGMQNGYDLQLVENIRDYFKVPSTFLGGASCLDDIGDLIAKIGVGGCAAGSLFVFKGKYRAVLINYPKFEEKLDLIIKSMKRFNQNN